MEAYISVIPAMQEVQRRVEVQASPGIKGDPISKVINAKRAGTMAQMVKELLSKLKVLSSVPSTGGKKKR
jgi:hypothetical protein